MATFKKLGFEVCGSAGTWADSTERVAKMQPEIVLMDITLKGEMHGMETAEQIKKDFTIPVICLITYR